MQLLFNYRSASFPHSDDAGWPWTSWSESVQECIVYTFVSFVYETEKSSSFVTSWIDSYTCACVVLIVCTINTLEANVILKMTKF